MQILKTTRVRVSNYIVSATCGGVWVVPMTPAPKQHTVVEVTLEKVYYSKLKFTIVNGAVSVTGIFHFYHDKLYPG